MCTLMPTSKLLTFNSKHEQVYKDTYSLHKHMKLFKPEVRRMTKLMRKPRQLLQ